MNKKLAEYTYDELGSINGAKINYVELNKAGFFKIPFSERLACLFFGRFPKIKNVKEIEFGEAETSGIIRGIDTGVFTKDSVKCYAPIKLYKNDELSIPAGYLSIDMKFNENEQ